MTDPDQLIEQYRRVLVVEDEQRLADLYGKMMPELGYRAMTVGSGEAALEAMAADPWPIVLLDINLPAMTGLECLAQIRAKHPETQAIILTGFGDLEAAKQAIHLDVVEFLTKPCHLGDLEVALDRAQKRIRKLLVEKLGDKVETEQKAQPAAPIEDAAIDDIDDDEIDGPTSLADLERKAIIEALERNEGNRRATAKELGISVRTLYYRLDEYRAQGFLD